MVLTILADKPENKQHTCAGFDSPSIIPMTRLQFIMNFNGSISIVLPGLETPTITRMPSWANVLTPACCRTLTPVVSRIRSTPSGKDSRRPPSRSGVVFVLIECVAPSDLASSSFSSTISTAMMFSTPSAFAARQAANPTAPIPYQKPQTSNPSLGEGH